MARCFRDEDLRADRQPEFTQLDLEVAFMDADQIQTLMEGLIKTVFKQVGGGEDAPELTGGREEGGQAVF